MVKILYINAKAMLYNVIQGHLVILLCAIAASLIIIAQIRHNKRIYPDVIIVSFFLVIASAIIAFGMNLLMKSQGIKTYIVSSQLGKEITVTTSEFLLLLAATIILATLIGLTIVKKLNNSSKHIPDDRSVLSAAGITERDAPTSSNTEDKIQP